MTGMGPGLMILALVCSTANLLNSSTVAPPLLLSNTTTIPRIMKNTRKNIIKNILKNMMNVWRSTLNYVGVN